MSSKQPQYLREVLRRIQDPNVSREEADRLFVDYVQPEVEIAITTYAFPTRLRWWIQENAVSTIWEKLVSKPRNHHRPSFDVSREQCSFRAWVAVVLKNEAESAWRRRRGESLKEELSEQPDCPADRGANAVENLRSLCRNLVNGLEKLSSAQEFHSSGQRRNGVDYFAVLVIHSRLQTMRLVYKAFYEARPDVACG